MSESPQTIADLLQTIPDPDPSQTAESYLTTLADTGYQAQVQANAYRIKLGLTLLAHKPSARKGVTAWETENAGRLGIEVRQLRNYCAAAKTVSAIATTLAVTVLDRPLAKVVVEAKRLQAGQPSACRPASPATSRRANSATPTARPSAQSCG